MALPINIDDLIGSHQREVSLRIESAQFRRSAGYGG